MPLSDGLFISRFSFTVLRAEGDQKNEGPAVACRPTAGVPPASGRPEMDAEISTSAVSNQWAPLLSSKYSARLIDDDPQMKLRRPTAAPHSPPIRS